MPQRVKLPLFNIFVSGLCIGLLGLLVCLQLAFLSAFYILRRPLVGLHNSFAHLMYWSSMRKSFYWKKTRKLFE